MKTFGCVVAAAIGTFGLGVMVGPIVQFNLPLPSQNAMNAVEAIGITMAGGGSITAFLLHIYTRPDNFFEG